MRVSVAVRGAMMDEQQAQAAGPSSKSFTLERQSRSSPRASSSGPSSPEVVEGFFQRFVDHQAATKDTTETGIVSQRSSRTRSENSPGNGSSKVTPFAGAAVPSEAEPVQLSKTADQLHFSRAIPFKENVKDISIDVVAGTRSFPKKKLEKEATLIWRDLTVKLEGKGGYSYKVVQSLTGYALPSTLTAVMGPSNAGKSSMLKALAGILPLNAKVYGEILLNGHPLHQLPPKCHAYVTNQTELIETLTVRETLFYSALLQLPSCLPCVEKTALVDGIIADMYLQDLSSTIVGGLSRGTGLALGERRRLSIALELLGKPRLIFVEKPLDNLDRVSGFLTVACLKRLAIGGCTVIISTERTCFEITKLFDKILLLADGKTLFFGGLSTCLEHFENAGFPCPRFQNPSDHFLQAVSWDFGLVASFEFLRQDIEQGACPLGHLQTSVIIRTLETAYKALNDASEVENMVVQLSKQESPVWDMSHQASGFTRLAVLTWRSFLNMSRDFTYYWLRCILYIALMLCIATVYYKLQDSLTLLPIRVSAIFFMVSFLSLLAIGSFPAMAHELKVYMWEQNQEHTGPLLFVLGNILSSLPYLFLMSAICSGVSYFLMGFQPVFGLFMYYVVNIFLCLAFAEGLIMLFASVTPTVFAGILVATMFQIVTILAGGYLRQVSDLPKPVWRYPASYIAYQTYAVEGLLQNEYTGISFGTRAGQDTLSRAYSNPNLKAGKWFNLLILGLLALGARLLLYVTLVVGRKFGSKHTKCNF